MKYFSFRHMNFRLLGALMFTGISTFGITICMYAQSTLLFGTATSKGQVTQVRVESDSLLTHLIYAPYGLTPVPLTNVLKKEEQLSFDWQYKDRVFHCTLENEKGHTYKGKCIHITEQPIHLVLRDFTEEDARMQGNFLVADEIDMKIIDRALTLLNDGRNWNQKDNRVCDGSLYPYKWSLFCALHQASIDVDHEYRHLRPALKAVREAIDEATSGKKFAHMLRDFNNEAEDFRAIANVLHKAKAIILEKTQTQK
jgi:hypothetical protein